MDNCKFYENVLKNYEHSENITVSKIDIEDACEKGENFVAKVERVAIYGIKDSRDFQSTVISKRLSESPLTKAFKFDKVYQNEVIFYKEILQILQKYSKHMLETPKCLHISDFFIYEDLNQSGYQLKPKGHRFSVEESKLVLKDIAKLHSASLSLTQNEPKTVENLCKNLYPFMNKDGNESLEKYYLEHLKTAIKIFEDMNNLEVVLILKSMETNIFLTMVEIFEKSTEIEVFNHGDLWGNNIFFKNTEIKVIDFQMIYYGSPAIDLTYFLWINLDSNMRKENINELLTYYIENIRTFSIENNVTQDIIDKLTFKWIREEMRAFSVYGLMCCFLFLPIFFMKPEDYMDNIEHSESNTDKWLKNMTETYRQTLIRSVLEFVDIQKQK